MGEEIERKFLVEKLPDNLEKFPHKEIKQFYTQISEDHEVRYRKKGDKFYYTEKIGTGINRKENESEITEEEYLGAFENSLGSVEKTRYEIPTDPHIAELDVYHGKLSGMVTVEVEFDSEESAELFKIPEWFGREITEDKNYKNKNLALTK